MGILVRAKDKGFYESLREPGDEFEVRDEKAIGKWMERVDQKSSAKPDAGGKGKPTGE